MITPMTFFLFFLFSSLSREENYEFGKGGELSYMCQLCVRGCCEPTTQPTIMKMVSLDSSSSKLPDKNIKLNPTILKPIAGAENAGTEST